MIVKHGIMRNVKYKIPFNQFAPQRSQAKERHSQQAQHYREESGRGEQTATGRREGTEGNCGAADEVHGDEGGRQQRGPKENF